MLFLSRVRLGGGPGRSLCSPTPHGLSDGPFRRLKFKLLPHKVNKHFREVLVSADVDTLVFAAKEALLLDASQAASKPSAFWEVFSKRTKASAHLLRPSDAALIAAAFERHGKDTGIFHNLATAVANFAAAPRRLDSPERRRQEKQRQVLRALLEAQKASSEGSFREPSARAEEEAVSKGPSGIEGVDNAEASIAATASREAVSLAVKVTEREARASTPWATRRLSLGESWFVLGSILASKQRILLQYPEIFVQVAHALPRVLHELTGNDLALLTAVLAGPSSNAVAEESLCKTETLHPTLRDHRALFSRVAARKLEASSDGISLSRLALAVHAFGVWGDRPLALFQKVLQRALEDQSELSVEESLLLLRGFSLAVFDAEGFRQKVAARVQLQKVSLKKADAALLGLSPSL